MTLKISSLYLCAVCVFLFVVQLIVPGFTDSLQLTSAAYTQIWRFVSAIFLHASTLHLLYNMFALALFGFILEQIIGTKKFLIVFFVTGIIANIIAGFFYSSSLGASGAIFGVIGCLVILRPKMAVWAFGLPMPLFIAGIFWVAGDVFGAAAFLAGSPFDNTGNIAHLSGVFIGMIFGAVWRKSYALPSRQKAYVHFNESAMQSWEDRYMK
jgi:membrane associated rhomboid family serine protease